MTIFAHAVFWLFMWSGSIYISMLPEDPTLFVYAYRGSVHFFGLCDLIAYHVPFLAAAWIEALYPFVDKR